MESLISGLHFALMSRTFLVDIMVSSHTPAKFFPSSHKPLEPNKYYHVSCMERIFPDLTALVERGVLQMEGGVTQLSPSWQTERFHNAVEDWFHYAGRTFDMEIYDRFQKEYAKWDRKSSMTEINHHFDGHEGSSRNCERCGDIPDEPLRKDYFPEERRSCRLSEVLASVIGVQHLDEVVEKPKSGRRKKVQQNESYS